ncbi:DUF1761 domain-containing protein [Ekhidna sp.]|uniref:DUF1761 domain-containing protein n=1 Tax=Ekhidna sp. TaxID=2608089 RepID=UPI003B5C0E4B
MTAKNRILATLVGFVVLFLLGWLFYGILLMDFYADNTGSATNLMRAEDEMIWWALILGNLLQAYFLVYIFSKWEDINTFGAGFKGGAILGLILGLGFNLTMYATSNMMNLIGTLVDPIVYMVMMGITGGVIGMMLGRK